MIPFFSTWMAVYIQMESAFFQQGDRMDLRLFKTQINPSQMGCLNCLAVIVFIPIFDNFLYPWVDSYRQQKSSPVEKIGCGYVAATLAMVVAGIVEIRRKAAPLMQGDAGFSKGLKE